MSILDELCRTVFAALLGAAFSAGALAADVTGAGATFPYAVYTKWAEAYRAATRSKVNYQGIGSSGGLKQLKARTVDFGGTDIPVNEQDLGAAGLLQVPTVMGGVTLVMNVPGFSSGQLRLDGRTAADIFAGAITRWNDPAIARLNRDAPLPNLAITVAHRSDGSGTTYAFTHYLARQSPAFARKVGTGSTVNWPSNAIGGKGNPGVAANVKKIKGTIGYVDIADAMRSNMHFIALRNKAGNFVLPSQQTISDAAAGANFRIKGMAPGLLDKAHGNAWPITMATYILMYEQGSSAEKQKAVVDFLRWSLTRGRKLAEDLGFVPLPEAVVKMVETEIQTIR
jgi:phosphate transport system substrate-binding protein